MINCRWRDGVINGHRTCDLSVTGLSPSQAPLRSGLRQATCVPLSPSSITWHRLKGGDALRLGMSGDALAQT